MTSRKRERGEQTSHKVIEKRRRDRINHCLSELSQTVPTAFAKQTSGKLEKAEILEMTVEYLRAIQRSGLTTKFENGYNSEMMTPELWSELAQHYHAGYSECMREIMRYLTDIEGIDVNDSRYIRIMAYLQQRFRPDAISLPTGSSTVVSASETTHTEANTYSSSVPSHFSCTVPKSIATEQLTNTSSVQQSSHHHISGLHRCNGHAHTHHFCSYTLPNSIPNTELKPTPAFVSGCGGMLTSSCNVAMPTPIKAGSPLHYATATTFAGPVTKATSHGNHCVPTFTAINATRVKPLPSSHFPSLMSSHMTSSTPLSVTSSNGILSHSVVVP